MEKDKQRKNKQQQIWTQEEDKILHEFREQNKHRLRLPNNSVQELADKLGRSRISVNVRLHFIKNNAKYMPWLHEKKNGR